MSHSQVFELSNLFVTNQSRLAQYKPGPVSGTVGWGQRKLLLNEIAFFSLFWSTKVTKPICVYVGAADGLHFPVLAALFPELTFHLYDPREFAITESDNIKLFRSLFTDEIAKSYAGRQDIYFISDIRSEDHMTIRNRLARDYNYNVVANPNGKGYDFMNLAVTPNSKVSKEIATKLEAEVQTLLDDAIWQEMAQQATWVRIIKPVQSLLKFRLPYPTTDVTGASVDRTVKYLKGRLFWEPWTKPKSTETKLVPDPELVDGTWSIVDYQDMCYYHNSVERLADTYYNPATKTLDPIDSPELLNDYDSVAEAVILTEYLKFRAATTDIATVIGLSRLITQSLSRNNKADAISIRRASSLSIKPKRITSPKAKKPSTKPESQVTIVVPPTPVSLPVPSNELVTVPVKKSTLVTKPKISTPTPISVPAPTRPRISIPVIPPGANLAANTPITRTVPNSARNLAFSKAVEQNKQ